jgi:hypothetical protein
MLTSRQEHAWSLRYMVPRDNVPRDTTAKFVLALGCLGTKDHQGTPETPSPSGPGPSPEAGAVFATG